MPYKIKPCVYKIVNNINGHKYVGSALRVKQRWHDHAKLLDENRHHSQRLQRAWNKYGKDNFRFSIIEYCDREVMLAREQHWMDTLGAFGKTGYNMNPVAWSRLGAKMSEESCMKIGAAKKGTVLTEEHKAKVSVGMLGKQNSLGYKHTEETCEKRANATAEVWLSKGTDERLLRVVNAALGRNSPPQESGFTAVYPKSGKWEIRLTVNKKRVDLGLFPTPEAANAARVKYLTDLKEELESKLANPQC